MSEQVKVQLSSQARSVVQIQEIAYGPEGKALDFDFELERTELEKLTEDLVDRTFAKDYNPLRDIPTHSAMVGPRPAG